MTENHNDAEERLQGRPIIFGEVLFDQFPDGASVLGGAPFNVAWHLQGFGRSPLFLSCIGIDDPGSGVRKAMTDWGMDLSGLQTNPEHPTGAVHIQMEEGQHSFDILPDQAYDHMDAAGIRQTLESVEAACLYHGTLIMRTDKVHQQLDELVTSAGLPVFVDVNLRAPWWQEADLPVLLERARWVKMNDEELTVIARLLGHATDSMEDTAMSLQAAYDIALLIITVGDTGALAFESDGEVVRVKPSGTTHVVDTVGAGDAFSAVVITGLLENWPLASIMERAQAFASRICGQRGAISRDAETYQALTQAWREGRDDFFIH